MPSALNWRQISCRHADDRDCLGSFFAWQSAEVLAGGKPANLFNVQNRPLPCGRNMATLWDRYAAEVSAQSGTRLKELLRNGTRLLVLVYRPAVLAETLVDPRVARVLDKIGYPVGSLEKQLAFLLERMQQEAIPHEIGFFLGYPVKDVLAFMGEIDLPLTYRGPWTVYGDTRRSLELARHFGRKRDAVRTRLAAVKSPFELRQMQDRDLAEVA